VKSCEASYIACKPAVTRRDRSRRRFEKAPARRAPNDPRSRSVGARGVRGELRFRLQYHQGGLYVEREEIPCRGLHCVQSMHFRDVEQFEQWCDRDPARFEHPLLHQALKRDAGSLWQLREQPDA
jgi:hypothetical protein